MGISPPSVTLTLRYQHHPRGFTAESRKNLKGKVKSCINFVVNRE